MSPDAFFGLAAVCGLVGGVLGFFVIKPLAPMESIIVIGIIVFLILLGRHASIGEIIASLLVVIVADLAGYLGGAAIKEHFCFRKQ